MRNKKSLKETISSLKHKPDVLFIITDQERATQHFPDNWEQENLPTLTKLKNNGFSFDRAFCNSCMCTPSRATLFTGTYPAQHRATQTLTDGGVYSDGEIQLNPQTPNIGRILDDAGYDVQYRGKWHLSKGLNYGEVTHKDVSLFGFKGWVGPDAGEDAKPENFGGGFANADAMYVEQAIEYLEQVKEDRKNGIHKPYCLVLSLVNPHDVLAYPNNTQYGYNPEDWSGREIELPESVHEELIRNKKPISQFQNVLAMAGMSGNVDTDEKKLDYLNFYAHLLKKIDGEIGKVIDTLYDKKCLGKSLAENTIVVRLSDHGEMGMSHGGMRQKAFVAYEEALRVPLVISNPKLFKGGRSNHLASLIDVVPTLCSLLGVTPPPDARGVDLTPIIEEDRAVQDVILFTFDDTKSGSTLASPSSVKNCDRLRTIRTKDWKFTRYFHALGAYNQQYELYNLNDDPNELNNLAYSKEYLEQRSKMEIMLRNEEEKKLTNRPITFKSKVWVETNPLFQDFVDVDRDIAMDGISYDN